MKRNHILLQPGVTLMILLYFACVSWAAEISLKLAHVAPNGSTYDVASQKFAERVAARTDGKMEVRLFGGSQLGNPFELWAQLKSGAIDIHVMDVGAVNMVEEKPKNFSITAAPYLFNSQEGLHTFLQSDLFKTMMAKVEKSQNMKYLGYFGDGAPRGFSTTKKKVTTLEDMKGLKLRVPQIPVFISIYKAWGATPTPVSPGEVYNSLKTGMVDGMDQNQVEIYLAKYYEIQKYYTALDYLFSGTAAWINADRWTALPEDMKAAINQSVKETADYLNQYNLAQMQEAVKGFEAAGVEFIRPDLGPWKAVAEKQVREMEGKLWEEGLYDKIKALQ